MNDKDSVILNIKDSASTVEMLLFLLQHSPNFDNHIGFNRNSIVSFYSKIVYSYSQTTKKDDSESNLAMMNDTC
jgi:hypothetical protein